MTPMANMFRNRRLLIQHGLQATITLDSVSLDAGNT
jgi:hypothetical protein